MMLYNMCAEKEKLPILKFTTPIMLCSFWCEKAGRTAQRNIAKRNYHFVSYQHVLAAGSGGVLSAHA